MMKEMVKRTINNLQGELPDMMIIDGGREHLELPCLFSVNIISRINI